MYSIRDLFHYDYYQKRLFMYGRGFIHSNYDGLLPQIMNSRRRCARLNQWRFVPWNAYTRSCSVPKNSFDNFGADSRSDIARVKFFMRPFLSMETSWIFCQRTSSHDQIVWGAEICIYYQSTIVDQTGLNMKNVTSNCNFINDSSKTSSQTQPADKIYDRWLQPASGGTNFLDRLFQY